VSSSRIRPCSHGSYNGLKATTYWLAKGSSKARPSGVKSGPQRTNKMWVWRTKRDGVIVGYSQALVLRHITPKKAVVT